MKDVLFDIIVKEDPEEAKRIGILQSNITDQDDFELGKIEEDEEKKLLSQIRNIVNKFWEDFETKNFVRTRDFEEEINKNLSNETKRFDNQLKSSINSIESQVNVLAT